MALTSFLFGKGNQLVTIADALVVDAAIQVVPTRETTPTKNPVELGSDITDHVRLENLRLQIDGFISEAPLSTIATILGGLAAGLVGTVVGGRVSGIAGTLGTAAAGIAAKSAVSALSGGSGALAADPTSAQLEASMKNRDLSDTDFPKKAFEYLLAVQRDRLPFKIVTGFKTYKNMIITSLTSTQDAEHGKSLNFSMTCEQIQIVSSSLVKVPENLISAASSHSAASKAKTGAQSTTEPEDTQGSSIAYKLFIGK